MPNQSLDKIPTQTPPTINFAPVFKITNGTNNDNEISDTKQNDDINENMTIPGIKVKTDNKESTEKVDESNNNFFTGGLVIKKSQ
jgi:hypothetical protein